MTSTQNNLNNEVENILAKHFPDESPHELLSRMQSLLTFVGKIDPKILSYTNTAGSAQKQQITGHQQPVMLHQFNQANKKSAHSSTPKLEEEVRATLISQISKLQEINHLEPAQRMSASATHRMKP